MKNQRVFLGRLVAIFLILIAFASCESNSGPGEIQGMDVVSGPAGDIPPGTVDPDQGSGCAGKKPNQICLALKYLVFKNSSGTPVVSQTGADGIVSEVNSIWEQCGIYFTLEKYLAIDPNDYHLEYRTANYSDLTEIRNLFSDSNTLLVATTGTWNRYGSLGNTGANAWTSMPGSDPYGAILESPVSTNSNIIAHELGHYLNLLHVSDSYALMNPIIYSNSMNIYSSQCSTARSAALYFWQNMLRN